MVLLELGVCEACRSGWSGRDCDFGELQLTIDGDMRAASDADISSVPRGDSHRIDDGDAPVSVAERGCSCGSADGD